MLANILGLGIAMDGLYFPIVLASGCLMAAASTYLASHMLKKSVDLCVIFNLALLLCWSEIVFSSCLLGTLGLLSHFNLVCALSLVSASVLLFLKRQKYTCLLSKCAIASRFPAFKSAKLCVFYISLVSFGVFSAGVFGGNKGIFPMDWDSLDYHILLIHSWIRECSFLSTWSNNWFNPGNTELIGYWLCAGFSGDFFICFINIIPFLILTTSIVNIFRFFSALNVGTILAVGLVFFSEVIFRQIYSQKNDLAVVSLFISSFYYMSRYIVKAEWGFGIATFLSLGLLFGVKYYASGYFVSALIIWAIFVCRSNKMNHFLRLVLAGIPLIILLGGWWYLRNTLITGSPIYPVGFAEQTDQISKWRPNGIWDTTVIGNKFFGDNLVSLLKAVFLFCGFGWGSLITLFPFFCVCYYFTGARREANLEKNGVGLLIWFILASLAVFSVTPFVIEIEPGSFEFIKDGYLPSRFNLPFLILALILSIVMINRLAVRLGISSIFPAFCYSVLASQIIPFFSIYDHLIMAVLATTWCVALGAAVCCFWRQVYFAKIICFVVLGYLFANLLSFQWHRDFDFSYSANKLYSTIEAKPLLGNSKCVFFIGRKPYALAGSRRTVKIVQNFNLVSEVAFLNLIKDNDVDLVIFDLQCQDWSGRFSLFHKYIRGRRDLFVCKHNFGRFVVYKTSFK